MPQDKNSQRDIEKLITQDDKPFKTQFPYMVIKR